MFKGDSMTKTDDLTNNSLHPNVLVLSHNCFSTNGSNGRTLGNLFINWPKEALAQFYISSETPDSTVCDNYFRVTDTEALKAIYKKDKFGKIVTREVVIENHEDGDVLLRKIYKKHRKKTSFNYLLRNLVWDSNRWRSEKFTQWLNKFNPDVILLQVGDFSFMFKIALSVAKERNIPLLLFNSEDYYFKDRKSSSLLHHLFRFQYKRKFEELINYASHTVYICDMLQGTYDKRFNHKSTVIMNATEILPLEVKKDNNPPIISYLGNLGVGRHEPLIEIANSLQMIDSSFYLDIYGKMPSNVVETELVSCSGIRYKGLVSYGEVARVMQESDLLVHAENSSEFYQWDLKHAFSTKIADSLASGTCFFVYAPESMACTEYFRGNNAACVVSHENELIESLENLFENKELRQAYIDRAKQVVNKRHNVNDNARKLKNIICDIAKKVRGQDENLTSELRL
jgi:glycosyltransferase involved in cell wall biosynthesis